MNAAEGYPMKPGQRLKVNDDVKSILAGMTGDIKWVSADGACITASKGGINYSLFFWWVELEEAA